MEKINSNEQASTEKLLSHIERMAYDFDEEHNIHPTKGFLGSLLFDELCKVKLLEQADPKQTTDPYKIYKLNKPWAMGIEFYAHEKLANEQATRKRKRQIEDILSTSKPIGITLTAPGILGKIKYIRYEDFVSKSNQHL